MSGLNIKLLIAIFLAAPPALGQLTPLSPDASPTPGFAPCPDGILCPILPRQEEAAADVTVIDPDCENATPTPTLAESANLPLQIRPQVLPTTLVTVTACPGDCDAPTTETICPPEGCDAPAPVATRLAICPPEECPECSPDACTPCPADSLECEVCEDCPPPCPDYCPPPAETTSDQLAPVPNPTPTLTPTPTTPARSATMSVTLPDVPVETEITAPTGPPVAGAERMAVSKGVYVAVGAVFLAMNLF